MHVGGRGTQVPGHEHAMMGMWRSEVPWGWLCPVHCVGPSTEQVIRLRSKHFTGRDISLALKFSFFTILFYGYRYFA